MVSPVLSKWMRGIAILMVIASHYAGWMAVEPANPGLRDAVTTLGVYGVDIFFAMSGYGLVKSAAKTGVNGKFVWNRFKTSYLPYFLIVGTLMLMDGLFRDVQDVVQFLTGQDYWFMAVLFAIYLLFMICYKIGKFRGLTFFLLLLLYTYYLYRDGRAYFWIVSNMAFFVGVLFAETEKYLAKNSYRWLILLTGCLGTWYFYRQFKLLGHPVMNTTGEAIYIEIYLSSFFTIAVMAMCTLLPKVDKSLKIFIPLEILGSNSLFIYLLHARLYYPLIDKMGNAPYFLRVTAVGCITLLFGCMLGFLFRKGMTRLENKCLGGKHGKLI